MSTTTIPSHLHGRSIKAINAWLDGLNYLPLECDGMSRYISALLHRDGISHKIQQGLIRNNVGESINHLWISLNENYIIDLRARMWMGSTAGHGIFIPDGVDTKYEVHGYLCEGPMDDFLLTIMTGRSPDSIPDFPVADVAPAYAHNDGGQGLLLDQSGSPLLVFRGEHGSLDGSMNVQTNLASYSFSTASIANIYSQVPNNKNLWIDGQEQSCVIPCYLKMQNPVFDNGLDPLADFTDIAGRFDRQFAIDLFLRFSGYAEATNAFEDAAHDAGVSTIKDLAKICPEALDGLCIQIFPLLDDEQFIRDCEGWGYDGAVYRGSGESLDAVEYRVFSQDQIVYCLSPDTPAPGAVIEKAPVRPVRSLETGPSL